MANAQPFLKKNRENIAKLKQPSPLKLQNVTTPNGSLMIVCCMCRFGISFTYVIEVIESKLISVCFINDYTLIADLHILIYGRAEFSSISLECTNVKLLILNNFDLKFLTFDTKYTKLLILF